MKEAGLPAPIFAQDDFMLRVTIKKTIGTLNGTLNDTQRKILNCIRINQGINAQSIIDKVGIPRNTLNKVLKYLIDNKLIERRGSKKTGGYYIVATDK